MAKQDLEQEIKGIVDAGVERTLEMAEQKALPPTKDKTVLTFPSSDHGPSLKNFIQVLEQSVKESEAERDELSDRVAELDVIISASKAFLEIAGAKQDAADKNKNG